MLTLLLSFHCCMPDNIIIQVMFLELLYIIFIIIFCIDANQKYLKAGILKLLYNYRKEEF